MITRIDSYTRSSIGLNLETHLELVLLRVKKG